VWPVESEHEPRCRVLLAHREMCGDRAADRFVPMRGPTVVSSATEAACEAKTFADCGKRVRLLVLSNAGRVLVRFELNLARVLIGVRTHRYTDLAHGVRKTAKIVFSSLDDCCPLVRVTTRPVAITRVMLSGPGAIPSVHRCHR